MSLSPEDRDYMHETFISRKECSECTQRIREELAQGTTAFATIRQDLQYIKDRLDKKNKINFVTVSGMIQAVCTLLVAIIASRLGLQ